MQFILSAAILAASQPLMASAAYLPARQVPNPGNMTASYGQGNSSTAFPTTGGTGYGTGYATGHMTTHRSAHGTGVHTTKEAPPVTTKAVLSSAPVMMNSTANSTGDASPSRSVQLQPSAINNLGYDAPVYNLNNSTCGQMADLNYTAQWAAVAGDDVVDGFQKMWNGNLLICSECFGLTKDQCTSSSLECAQGLHDLAKLPGSNVSRWDTAAARFAADADITDLQCSISTNACNSPPSCGDCNGPGSFAILKSLSVLDNAMSNVYRAIQDAGSNCEDQMQSFSDVFAPLPNTSGESMFLTIMMAIVGALIGAVSLLAGPLGIAADTAMGIGLAAGAIADVGSGVGMQMFYEHQPGPADTGSVLGSIVNQTAEQYFQITDALFSTGTYSYRNADNTQGTQLTLQNMMKGGNLMETSAQPNGLYEYLLPNFELIMYQQLAFYTWSNLEKDKKNHIPFIAFNPKPCDQVSTKDPGFGSGDILDGVIGLDSNVTYDGACYWLLDALPTTKMDGAIDTPYGGAVYETVCGAANSLPGGTNKAMSQAGQTFSGLSLHDFIDPSVGGWKAHNKNNDYQLASANGQLVDTPTTAGAINIPVCDYVGNPKMPGVNCPKLGYEVSNNKCELVPLNAEPNAPGTFQPGWCGLHVIQYQKTEGNENPLSVYQLEVTINDAAQRQVGDAAKQAAGSPLSIAGALPYDLIVATGATDNDPIEFWYADQYWTSDSKANQCKVGGYDGGNRQMDCGFNCPMVIPENGDKSSATIAHKLPAAPTPAVIGATSYLNTWPADATTTAAPTSTGLAKPAYATGACGVHVRQHQKNEPDNETPNYEVEVTLYDAKQKAIGTSGQVPAPKGVAVDVTGLVQKFTVTAGAVDDDPLSFTYGSEKWSSSDKQCSVGKYDSGHRDMDCGFTCNP